MIPAFVVLGLFILYAAVTATSLGVVKLLKAEIDALRLIRLNAWITLALAGVPSSVAGALHFAAGWSSAL